MLTLTQAVIVEGRYDKIRLRSLLDATILETNGFRIFKDKEKMALIRALAHKKGIVILTDSDTAGFRIRRYLQGAIPKEDHKNLYHAYIPEILGKEKRKVQPSKEGTLGVEGMSTEILVSALERTGVLACRDAAPRPDPVTKLDFYEDGLTGRDDSSALRAALMKQMGLPHYLAANALLDVVNAVMTREEYRQALEACKTAR